jgi:AraC-like DNA-binding protein
MQYRLWGRNETGLAEWIAGERLAGAARDLRDPAAAAIPVAAVAREWGFTDPARFSRRFRRAYAHVPTGMAARSAAPAGPGSVKARCRSPW